MTAKPAILLVEPILLAEALRELDQMQLTELQVALDVEQCRRLEAEFNHAWTESEWNDA
jgi:hypothetical protein